MELLTDPQVWLAFFTLAALEIVLGIDNIVFITILVGRLPEHQRARGRFIGLAIAMISRIALLLSITWVMGLTDELFSVAGHAVSGRDLILFVGGGFLIAKATMEIHHALEGAHADQAAKPPGKFWPVVIQIGIIDIVFSLDSVITAVGLAEHVPVMVAAIITAVLVMMLVAGPVGDFVERHPTVKMLALSFLILIGTALVAESFGFHVPKGYIYFAMGFSIAVELLNMKLRKTDAKAVALRQRAPD